MQCRIAMNKNSQKRQATAFGPLCHTYECALGVKFRIKDIFINTLQFTANTPLDNS